MVRLAGNGDKSALAPYTRRVDKILNTIRPLIPRRLFRAAQPAYHYALALAGKILYQRRYRRLRILGVTGTKGKTTVTELAAAALSGGGLKVAVANGIRFAVDGRYERKAKQSMPGRLELPRFLLDAAGAGCDWAVVEMTSEGAAQFRHLPIALDALVVTNLAPEHLEAHGSFEAYREAKMKIVRALRPRDGKAPTLIVNGDDLECAAFADVGKKLGASVVEVKFNSDVETDERGVSVKIGNAAVRSPLAGTHNAKNILLAAAAARAAGVSDSAITHGIAAVTKIPGRGERVEQGQPFSVVVDYAHTPDSLEAIFGTYTGKRRICVFGSAGGGRDRWKRPEMGSVAARLCDVVILTEDDSYKEDPAEIIAEIAAGTAGKAQIVLDRREAIRLALSLAKPGDAVIVAGMGAQEEIRRAAGPEPWSDATVCRGELAKLGYGSRK